MSGPSLQPEIDYVVNSVEAVRIKLRTELPAGMGAVIAACTGDPNGVEFGYIGDLRIDINPNAPGIWQKVFGNGSVFGWVALDSASFAAAIAILQADVASIRAQPFVTIGGSDTVLPNNRSVANSSTVQVNDGGPTGPVSWTVIPNSIGDAQIRQSAGTSVLGNPTGATADVQDIVATVDNTFLQRQGGVLVWGPGGGGGASNLQQAITLQGAIPTTQVTDTRIQIGSANSWQYEDAAGNDVVLIGGDSLPDAFVVAGGTTAAGAGQGVAIGSGTASSPGQAGGALALASGTGNTTGPGGGVTITAGGGGASAVGGSVVITAGAGGATTGDGGNVDLVAGASPVTVPGMVRTLSARADAATLSPPALAAGATQNYAPTGNAAIIVFRITPDVGGSSLGGLASGRDGRVVYLTNISTTATLQLTNEDALSTAANRFALPGATTFAVAPQTTVALWYDIASARWRTTGTSSFPAASAVTLQAAITGQGATPTTQALDTRIQIGDTNSWQFEDADGNDVVVIAGDDSVNALVVSGGTTGTGAGQGVLINAGAAATATQPGGGVSISGGDGSTSGPGGAVVLMTGAGGATGASGSISITTGSGGSTSGISGSIVIGTGSTTSGNTGSITLSTANGTGANGVAGDISLIGGSSNGTGEGADIILTAGATTNGTLATAGDIQGTGGAGGTSATGGLVIFTGGAGGTTSGAGGGFTARGGNATTLGAGGTVSLQGGDGAGAAQNGGPINIFGGLPSSTGAGVGGAVSITGGDGAGTPGSGGAVFITGGTAGAALVAGIVQIRGGGGGSAAPGGAVSVSGGQGGTGAVGGAATVQGGAGGATSGAGGALNLLGGVPTGSGAGGAVTIQGGNGSSNVGGAVSIIAGNGSNAFNGGGITLTAGSGGTTNPGGSIVITSGAGGSTSGNSGNVDLVVGAIVSGTPGMIRSLSARADAATLSPPALAAGATQNYAPTGNAAIIVFRITPDAGGSSLGGLASGRDGRVVYLTNISTTATLQLTNEDALSTAANRFALPNASTLSLAPQTSVALWYDVVDARWRTTGTSSFPAAASVTLQAAITGQGATPTTQALDTRIQIGNGNSWQFEDQGGVDVVVIAGDNSASAFIVAGGTTAVGAGQTVAIGAGTASSPTQAGGALALASGSGNTTGPGGGVTITAGGGGASAVGGSVVITAGAGGATTGDGGNVDLVAGASPVTVPGMVRTLSARADVATITPAALATGVTQDYAPAGNASAIVFRLTPDAAGSSLGGLAGGREGRIVVLTNLSTSVPITLTNENASSTAANRFALPALASLVIQPQGTVELWYDVTSARWRSRSVTALPALAGLEGNIYPNLVTYIDSSDRNSYISGTTVLDETANATGGTLAGPVTFVDGAFQFNGASGSLTFAKGTLVDNVFSGGGTVLALIRPFSDGEGDQGRIADTSQSGASGWLLRSSGELTQRMTIVFQRQFTGGAGQWTANNIIEPATGASIRPFALGNWTSVAITYDDTSPANDPTFYANGEPLAITENTAPSGTPVSDVGNALVIGNRSDDTFTFNGQIEVFLLFDRILSPNEIRAATNAFGPRFAMGVRGWDSSVGRGQNIALIAGDSSVSLNDGDGGSVLIRGGAQSGTTNSPNGGDVVILGGPKTGTGTGRPGNLVVLSGTNTSVGGTSSTAEFGAGAMANGNTAGLCTIHGGDNTATGAPGDLIARAGDCTTATVGASPGGNAGLRGGNSRAGGVAGGAYIAGGGVFGSTTSTTGPIVISTQRTTLGPFAATGGTDTNTGSISILTTGQGATASSTGNITIQCGNTNGVTGNDPGDIVITAGTQSSTTQANATAGGVTITAGANAGGGNSVGGSVSLVAGAVTSTGATAATGGDILLTGGANAHNNAASRAGNITGVAGAGTGTNTSGGTVSFTAGASSGTGTAGSAALIAGAGAAAAQGGQVTIQAGAGGATSGVGGSATINGGAGGGSGNGGQVIITGGAAGATGVAGGSITIQGGTATQGAGGGVTISGRAGVGTNRNGGAVQISAGDATGSGTGANVVILAGRGGATGTAGVLTLTGGAGGTTSGNAGGVTIQGGTPVDGNGGAVNVLGSNGVGTNRNGGVVRLAGGDGIGSGLGGSSTVAGGASVTGAAGSVVISGGNSSSSGAGGNIGMTPGTSVSGTPGMIQAAGAFAFTAVSSPGALASGINNNYTAALDANVLRLTPDAASGSQLSGIAGGLGRNGRVLRICNIGTNQLVLLNASGSSTTTNQFLFPALPGDITLYPEGCFDIWYDDVSQRWRGMIPGEPP